MSGNDFMMKRFVVPMGGKKKENPCFDCINNKFRGGDIDICDSCEKHNHYKGVDNGTTSNNKDNQSG